MRLGSLHRNTYVDSPSLLLPSLQVAHRKRLLLAGQIVGVEGYVESAATGSAGGAQRGAPAAGEPPVVPPRATALGSLLAYVTQRGRQEFQPMNANYGLFPPLGDRCAGARRSWRWRSARSAALQRWCDEAGLARRPRPLAVSVA